MPANAAVAVNADLEYSICRAPDAPQGDDSAAAAAAAAVDAAKAAVAEQGKVGAVVQA